MSVTRKRGFRVPLSPTGMKTCKPWPRTSGSRDRLDPYEEKGICDPPNGSSLPDSGFLPWSLNPEEQCICAICTRRRRTSYKSISMATRVTHGPHLRRMLSARLDVPGEGEKLFQPGDRISDPIGHESCAERSRERQPLPFGISTRPHPCSRQGGSQSVP